MEEDPTMYDDCEVDEYDNELPRDPHPLQDLWPRPKVNKLIVKSASGDTVIDHLEPSVCRADIRSALQTRSLTGVFTIYAFSKSGRQLAGYATERIDPGAVVHQAGFVTGPGQPVETHGDDGGAMQMLQRQLAEKSKRLDERLSEVENRAKCLTEREEGLAITWLKQQRKDEREWAERQRQLELDHQAKLAELERAREDDRRAREAERIEVERIRRQEKEDDHRRDMEIMQAQHKAEMERIVREQEMDLKLQRERDKIKREKEREEERREIAEIKRSLRIDQIPIPQELQLELWQRKIDADLPKRGILEAIEQYGPMIMEVIRGLQSGQTPIVQEIGPLPAEPEHVELRTGDPFAGLPEVLTTED